MYTFIGSGSTILTNSIEKGSLVGEEDQGFTVVGGDDMPYEWRVSGLSECTLTCGGGKRSLIPFKKIDNFSE